MVVDHLTGIARSASGRQIGPIGTVGRIAGGLAAIAVPIALSGITWWDIGGALVALPLLAMLAAVAVDASYRRHPADPPRSDQSAAWIRNSLAVAIVLGAGTGLTFVSPVDGTAIWAFVGLSLLIAALRGDGGCEVVALPNALVGRRDPIGCVVYAPIDTLEKRWRRSPD
ncbi:MAG: hypothetical protein M3131_00630 [Actinomycetota bacterium]|nr:hypothetical protein [Actinomycetota bacterium]